MIPHEYVEEVVRRNDITDVVGSYVQLRHRGRTHTGLCPFHSEKTPSFVVYPETQSFYCFGCGAGGDVITFIKKISNLDYVEAVKLLAFFTSSSTPTPRKPKRPALIGGGAACPIPPSAASAWGTPPTTFRPCAAICGASAFPRRRCWPPAL